MQFPDHKVLYILRIYNTLFFIFLVFIRVRARMNAHVHPWGFRGFRGSPAMVRKSRGVKNGVTEIGRGYAVAVGIAVPVAVKKIAVGEFFLLTHF